MTEKERQRLDEEQAAINRMVDEKYHEPLKKIVSMAKEDPEKFAALKAMYETRELEADMGTMCSEPGCSLWSVVKGYCSNHAKAHGLQAELDIRNRQGALAKAKRLQVAGGVALPSVVDGNEPVIELRPAVPASFGKVTNADKEQVSFGMNEFSACSFMDALDEAWQVKRSQMLCALSGLSYKRSLRVQLDMLDAVDGLGEWA